MSVLVCYLSPLLKSNLISFCPYGRSVSKPPWIRIKSLSSVNLERHKWSGCAYHELVYSVNITYLSAPPSHPPGLGFYSFSSVNREIYVVELRVLFKKWWQIVNKNQNF